MTAYYKMPGFTLSRANTSTKILITAFLVTVLGGLVVSLLQYTSRAGASAQDAAEWVLGNEGDLEAREFKAQKSYRELLSITHEHAFSLPMLLFMLLHLVGLCAVGERLKIGLYLTGFLAFVGTIAGPWIIASVGTTGTAPLRLCGVLLTAVIGGSSTLVLHELWLAGPLRRVRKQADPPAPNPMFPRLRG